MSELLWKFSHSAGPPETNRPGIEIPAILHGGKPVFILSWWTDIWSIFKLLVIIIVTDVIFIQASGM